MANNRLHYYRQLSSYAPKMNKVFLGLLLTKVLLTVLMLCNPYLYSRTVDAIIAGKYKQMLPYLALLYLGVFLLETILYLYENLLANQFIFSLQEKLRCLIWRNIYAADYSKTRNLDLGEIKNTISNDVDLLDDTVRKNMIEYLFNLFVLLASAIWLMIISFKLFIILLLVIPLVYWITKLIGKKLNHASELLRKEIAEYEGLIYNSVTLWKSIKVLCLSELMVQKLQRLWDKVLTQQFRMLLYNFLSYFIQSLKDLYFVKIAVYIIAALSIQQNKMTIGTFILFISYFEYFVSAINGIVESELSIKQNDPSIARVFALCNYHEETKEKIGNIQLTELSFRQVYYKYEDQLPYVLEDLTEKFYAKEKILIKGNNGSGKSTIIKLILGFLHPVSGCVEISGVPIEHIEKAWIQNNVAVVIQDSNLFDMSIYENMLLANPDANKAEIEHACKLACIHDVIVRLQDGYKTRIGENGCFLSGGERQRLLLAQLFLRNPQIVILDESTSALDKETETIVNLNIDVQFSDRMIIRISHNSYQNHAIDHVLSIVNGKLTDETK